MKVIPAVLCNVKGYTVHKPISTALTHLRDLPLVVENRRTTAKRKRTTNFDILQLLVVSANITSPTAFIASDPTALYV